MREALFIKRNAKKWQEYQHFRDESTVKPIVSACSVQHLHIKGDYICRNVLQGFLQLLKSKSKVGRHLETLEVAKLYAQDMAVIREFVGSTGKHFKRLIFGLVDYQHNCKCSTRYTALT